MEGLRLLQVFTLFLPKIITLIFDDSTSIEKLLTPGIKVVITAHSNPDGDAIGSSLALMSFLESRGAEVSIMIPNDYPSFLAWMPGIHKIINYKKEQQRVFEGLRKADLVFSVDYNSPKRLERMQPAFDASNAVKVLIDHHPQPEKSSYSFLISRTDVSSTSELVYHFITRLGGEEALTFDMAECLFVGIATDTGSFSYSCSYEETFLVVAKLLRLRIDPEKIHRLVYDTYSESRMRLLGYCLSEKMKVMPEFSTAYISLSKEELNRYKFQVGDTEGVVNYALSVKGVCLAVLFTEKDNHVRISLRSKGQFSVNDFVRKHFEGGGHRNAAGGNSYLSLPDTLKKFESLLPDYQHEIKNSFVE